MGRVDERTRLRARRRKEGTVFITWINMQDIIAPVERSLLKQELNPNTFVRQANNGDNHIYIVNNHNAPHTLREIGRLRELTFRAAGGGTGLDCDLDDFDTCDQCYDQLVVWNPQDEEIVAGYRYIRCVKARQPDRSEEHTS